MGEAYDASLRVNPRADPRDRSQPPRRGTMSAEIESLSAHCQQCAYGTREAAPTLLRAKAVGVATAAAGGAGVEPDERHVDAAECAVAAASLGDLLTGRAVLTPDSGWGGPLGGRLLTGPSLGGESRGTHARYTPTRELLTLSVSMHTRSRGRDSLGERRV